MAVLQLLLDVWRELFQPSDDAEADVVGQQGVQLRAQIPLEQPHERADLGRRPLPVFDGERIQRQYAQAQARSGLDGVTHGINAGAVTLHPGQVALGGPAPIPVHDDCDVRRQPLEIHLPRERLVGMPGRDRRQELLKRHVRSPAFASIQWDASTERGRPESRCRARLFRPLQRGVPAAHACAVGCERSGQPCDSRQRPLIIFHPDQEQALRRSRGARLRAAARRQQRRHRRRRSPAAANLDERAHDGADHVVEKAVTADLVGEERPSRCVIPTGDRIGGQLRPRDRANGLRRTASRASERNEIVRPDQRSGRSPHVR